MKRSARWIRHALAAAVATTATIATADAEAYSTRLHIVIANHLRDALIQGDGHAIQLIGTNAHVRLSDEDASAIIENPLAFRAGAIGPDNMIFPGMTDPSHAVWQKPFEQCELLYRAALLPEERAYALGCFLHGSTDAVAHHFVNYLSGETFTLTPLKTGREEDYTNVVRHIAVEAMLEEAELKADPNAFAPGTLTHSIPIGFVQRAYLNEESPLYQLLSKRARARYQRARQARPNGLLHDILAISELEPADHLVLAPLYLDWVDESLSLMRGRFKTLQDWTTPDGSVLKVTPGPDGVLGTSDDVAQCSVGCPQLAAEYALYAHLMEPRKDAQGRPLPSAFDKVMGKLRSDLDEFVPAYLKTVDNFSSKLNTPYVKGQQKLDITMVDVDETFRPITEWALAVGRIDYDVLARAIIPDVWLDLWGHLRKLGIKITPPEVMKLLVGPYIEDLKHEVEERIVGAAKEKIKEFTATYRAQYASAKVEYEERLKADSPEGAYILDDLHASGLAAHTFNIAAAAIANRAVVLPTPSNDPVGMGPASFDTSYSTHWMQAGLCEPIRARVFPYGMGIKGLLTMKKDGQILEPRGTKEPPVECHDGTLGAFTSNPNAQSCEMVELPELVGDPHHRGSITRGYPPEHAANKPTCATGTDLPGWLTLGGPGEAEDEEGRLKRTTETTACGCSTPGSRTMGHGAGAAAIGFVLFAWRRRKAKSMQSTTKVPR